MKPVSFKYVAPTTTAEAVEVLAQYGADAKVIAGGQSLMPLGYLVTSLQPEEVLTEVRSSTLPVGTGWSVQEVSRRHGDFALVGVIALLRLERERIREARLTYFGLGGRAVRFAEIDGPLAGALPSAEVLAQAATRASAVVEANGDIHASADYRRAVAGVLTRRALQEALDRAREGARV